MKNELPKASDRQVKALCRTLVNRWTTFNNKSNSEEADESVKRRVSDFSSHYAMTLEQIQFIINTYEILEIPVTALSNLYK